jgi:hypothetical protein
MEHIISVKPGAPIGERWNLHIGAWDDPDKMYLPGFETWWDAWAFCVCNGLDDPLPRNKYQTRTPPERKEEQMKMRL